MIQISRMLGILVGLMFGVLIASFVFTMGSSAEGIASSEMQINNTEQMNQLVLYNAVIAYQCTPNKGGYEIRTGSWIGNYWSAWTEYKEASGASATGINWGHLEAAGSDLECYGSESKLPGIEGNIVDVYDDSWLNDQGGKFSRKYFEITTENVRLGPCLGYENSKNGKSGSDPQDVTFLFADETTDSGMALASGSLGSFFNNKGPGYSFGGSLSELDCQTVGSTSAGSLDGNDAVVITVNLLGEVDTGDADFTRNADGEPSVGKGNLDTNFETYRYTLCKGTKGYIQTNVGGATESAPFTTSNPPGLSDKEVGTDSEVNFVHPFIVFTEWTC